MYNVTRRGAIVVGRENGCKDANQRRRAKIGSTTFSGWAWYTTRANPLGRLATARYTVFPGCLGMKIVQFSLIVDSMRIDSMCPPFPWVVSLALNGAATASKTLKARGEQPLSAR